MKIIARAALLAVACLCAAGSVQAQEAAPPFDPEKRALAYELQECVGAKIRVTAQVFSLRADLAAANKRAEASGEGPKELEIVSDDAWKTAPPPGADKSR